MIEKQHATGTIKILLAAMFLLSLIFLYLNTGKTNNSALSLRKYNKSNCEIEFFFSNQNVILYEVDQLTTLVWSF